MTTVFATATLTSPSTPDPPRIDLWPKALQSAELLRGSLVRCGPGMRSVGWPETPRVRLAALAPWLGSDRVATHMTAAWVWGASRSPGQRLQVSTRVGRRGPTANNEWLRVYEMRYDKSDTERFGEFGVSTPLRTALDLLYSSTDFGTPETVACRLLMRMIDGGPKSVVTHVVEHRRPHSRLARQRLTAIV